MTAGAGQRIGDLVSSRTTVLESAITADVASAFREQPALEAMAVVDGEGRALGLLDRTKLLMRLAHQYGHALYARAPVRKLMGEGPLIVGVDEGLDTTLVRVLAREESDLYDAILVVDADRRPVGLVSVKQLILQQSTALANAVMERQMMVQRTRELEEMTQVKTSFIAHVTHELRSPVNAIIGMVELLAQVSREGDVAQTQELLSMLASSATSLRTLVTNVLDLSKLEAGRMQVFNESVDVVELVRDIGGVTRILVGTKPVRVEVRAHEGAVALNTDPVKLKQVLLNLASNAAKFTEKGEISLDVTRGADAVLIAVRDTGIGIAADQREKIFEPFVQADAVHTRRHEGTGLGLTITQRLLALLHGKLDVESSPGVGSVFRVRLPLLAGG